MKKPSAATKIIAGLREVTGIAISSNVEIRFTYKNWRGETNDRKVVGISIWQGKTQWHPEPQWFLRALDLEKEEVRDFAMQDMTDVTYV